MSTTHTIVPTINPGISPASLMGAYIFERQIETAQALDDTVMEHNGWANLVAANAMNLQKLERSLGQAPVQITRKIGRTTIHATNVAAPGKIAKWEIHDAEEADDVSWTKPVLTSESPANTPIKDPIVEALKNNLIASLVFFLEGLGLNSIDGNGFKILAAAHVGKLFDNAYYVDGKLHFGDGGGDIFKDFAKDLKVVAHELGHGIVEMSLGGLIYMGEAGALNEHIADLIGELTYQHLNNKISLTEHSWLLGDECMLDLNNVKYALRSLKAPGTAYVNHPVIGTDPQPATYDKKYTGSRDNGGVHINSGIANFAAYLAIMEVGDWKSLVKAWVFAVKKIGPRGNFKAFANATIQSAKEMFPQDTKLHNAIKNAWTKVKVLGPGAAQHNEALEVSSDDVIKVFKLDKKKVEDLRAKVDAAQADLAKKVKNFTGAVVGVEVNSKIKSNLVVMLYVSDIAKGFTYPKTFQGHKVVLIKYDPSLDPIKTNTKKLAQATLDKKLGELSQIPGFKSAAVSGSSANPVIALSVSEVVPGFKYPETINGVKVTIAV